MSETSTRDQNAIEPSTPATDCYVVGIGASAGGLEALEKFFTQIPTDTGMAFVVVQHLSPDFKSLMDELLARHTDMPIYRVENDMPVEPNGVYLIPPKKNMIISERRLLLTEQDAVGGLNLPIDVFFRSLAEDVGEKGLAVVLSGTGSDGSRGLASVHEAGGLVLVQDVQTAGFDGMPRNAISTGLADVIASPGGIAEAMCKFKESPKDFPRSETEAEVPILPGGELSAMFRLFRARYGVDFSLYRENTIHRRIDRRMQLIQAPHLSDYVRRLVDDTQELEALYRDLLVEVTHFFRDGQPFERLKEEVIPSLIDEMAGANEEVRLWVPGCATGEEAYSLAILLNEHIQANNLDPEIKIFATDVHRSSLEIASTGVYSADALTSLPPEYRAKYFTQHGALFHINRAIRQMVIFAPHDITKDPPFTKVDLISCRNVLIYLEPAVQERVLSLFHFGLKVGGTLLLGPSESIGNLAPEFDTVDQHWRIFRKLRDVRLPGAAAVRMSSPLFDIVKGKFPVSHGVTSTSSNDFVERTVLEDLLDRYVPPSFLVNGRFELIHSFGDARRLLMQPKGRPSLEVLKMVEGDLRMAMSAALHRVSREKEKIVLQGIRVESGEGTKLAQVTAEPYLKQNHDLYLISIVEVKDAPPPLDPAAETFRADDQAAQRVIDLERELEFNKESLQTTVEELEASNEELQSTNEELVAANEELQSTNEELHSVNEELYTVNAEHQRKIDELSQLTTDMDNLMRSTDIGTIFLDRDLRIRRFTPAISAAFNILDQDIGRPIDQFAYHFDSDGWLERARDVARTGEPYEVKLQARSDKVYLKRMRPYRNAERAVTGVVITFTDVTAVSKAEEERSYRQHLERVTRDLQDFAYAVSHDLQAPTRQIVECLEMLRDHLTEADEETLRLMVAAKDRTKSLSMMLQHLLEYSRINTRGRPFEPVNLESLVDQLKGEFAALISETEARVTCDSLPTINVDPLQIHTCFWHLLDNAIKFRSGQVPEIHFGAQQIDDDWQISIKDNGIGVNDRHIEDMFLIFRRLGQKENTTGAGVGLALCRRILERHGGQIWAESASHGTTIHMRIPA